MFTLENILKPKPAVENIRAIFDGSKIPIPANLHPVESLPNPEKIVKCALESGIFLNVFQFPTGCFTSLICLKPDGFKSGTILKVPEELIEFSQRSTKLANICESTVIGDISYGCELILYKDDDEEKNSDGYTCGRCGKMFSYEYYRDKHLKYTKCVDNGNRKFPCTICSRSFEKRDRLRIHILHVHENHRPHICTICKKSFSQSSSLNKHLRVHSGERPYKCEFCPKAFTASSILRTHIRQHSGEKPFKCSNCGKAFASHAAHDSHVRRSHR
ncbi:unnamed protein product [Caenorhabditis angaria]|uniref:C2H2-type domain-containing protein n=1 Tax=Caenorhabditis angaria TaxID=860376 RepID=A0A9P1J0E3_9PELO|nr:unnamed protein product [Caenorhabditis angaria]